MPFALCWWVLPHPVTQGTASPTVVPRTQFPQPSPPSPLRASASPCESKYALTQQRR